MNLMNLPDKPRTLTSKTLKEYISGKKIWHDQVWGSFWLEPVVGQRSWGGASFQQKRVLDAVLETESVATFHLGFQQLQEKNYDWGQHPANILQGFIERMLLLGGSSNYTKTLKACFTQCVPTMGERLYESSPLGTAAHNCLLRTRFDLLTFVLQFYSETAFEQERPQWERAMLRLHSEDQDQALTCIRECEQRLLSAATSGDAGGIRARVRL